MPESVQEIFSSNGVGSLATVNPDGTPWASPVHLAFDGQAVYWLSKDTAQHSQNIARTGRVSIAVWSPDESDGLKGVFIQASALALSGEEAEKARQIFAGRFGSVPAPLASAAAFKAPLGELNQDKSYGNCWYFYSQKD